MSDLPKPPPVARLSTAPATNAFPPPSLNLPIYVVGRKIYPQPSDRASSLRLHRSTMATPGSQNKSTALAQTECTPTPPNASRKAKKIPTALLQTVVGLIQNLRTMQSTEHLPAVTPDAGSASLRWHPSRRRAGAGDCGRSEKI